jgi:hypothetical protein
MDKKVAQRLFTNWFLKQMCTPREVFVKANGAIDGGYQ